MAIALKASNLGNGPLKGPEKPSLRFVDELSALRHRNNIDIIAEHLIVTQSCRILHAYANPKETVDNADILDAMRSLDSMVARSLFNRDKLVGMLDGLLNDVKEAARCKSHGDVVSVSTDMRKLLAQYKSHSGKPLDDYVE